jgi:hypothetical protein
MHVSGALLNVPPVSAPSDSMKKLLQCFPGPPFSGYAIVLRVAGFGIGSCVGVSGGKYGFDFGRKTVSPARGGA